MAWDAIDGQTGKSYVLAIEGGANKYGSPDIFAHLAYTRIPFDNESGQFVRGDTISVAGGASAFVRYVGASYLLVSEIVDGPFVNDQSFTGSESGATADVNGSQVPGEEKVVAIRTATLGQAVVIVSDESADESFIDSEMASYA